MKKKQGFTLIEVLVIVFIMGIVAVIGGNMLFSIMKGTSKAEITKEVKQNGSYAIGVMERMIRNAQSVQSCSSSSIQIKNPDGNLTTFSFSGTRIASISATTAYLTGENVAVESGATFTCKGTTPEVVTISFTLIQAGGIDLRPEEKARVPFQTTIGLRTY